MHNLPITADMVAAGRSRLTLAHIECPMLWPDDARQRERALAACQTAEYCDRAASLAPGQRVAMTVSDFVLVTRQLVDAPSLAEIQDAVEMRFYRGQLAGWIFTAAIKDRRSAITRGLQFVKRDIISQLQGRHPKFKALSAATVENSVWSVFRGVAHLWAASHSLNEAHAARKDQAQFPCRLDEIEHFLAIAEAFRREAEATTGRQSGPLQDPDSTWRVPADIALPDLMISWPGR
jgi:hypothetical protein